MLEVSDTMLITLYARARESRRFDRYVLDFLEENPGGTIINLRCGFDTRFDRIDNWKMIWFNLFSSIKLFRKVQSTLHYMIGNRQPIAGDRP